LLSLALAAEPAWHTNRAKLASLSDAAVDFRYPNRWSTSADARDSFSTCKRIRSLARKSLGLKI
jgi:hypothetical protein